MRQDRRSTPLLAGLHDSDGREDIAHTRHNGYLKTIEGSVETAPTADERVLLATRQYIHVGIVDGANVDDVRIAGSDCGPREGAASAVSLGLTTRCSGTRCNLFLRVERINKLVRSVQTDEARKETRHKHLHDQFCERPSGRHRSG